MIEDYPPFKDVVDCNLFVGKGYISAVSQLEHHQLSIEVLLVLQKQHNYYENSAILLLQGQLDEALALLRMATELSRDSLVLSKNTSLIPLWNNREKEYIKYRKKFKFDSTHAPNAYAHKLYKLTSKYGVHGHRTTLCHSTSLASVVVNNEKFTELNITTKGIADVLTVWIAAFFAIYGNMSDCLKIRGAKSEAINSFNEILMEVFDGNKEFLNHIKEEHGIKFT